METKSQLQCLFPVFLTVRRSLMAFSPSQVLYSQFHKVPLDKTLGTLSRILEKDHFALIVHDQKLCKCTAYFSFS